MGKPKWKPKNADSFENNLERNKIHELRNILEEASTNKTSQTAESVTHICDKIADIFITSHNLTHEVPNPTQSDKVKPKK